MFFTTKRGWIGVDVGTHAVKLAQLVYQHGRLELAEARIVRRETAWQSDLWPQVIPLDSQREIQTALTLGERFQGRGAACTLPMAVCDLHGMAIPDANREAQEAQIGKELSELATRPLQFGFWPIQYEGDRHGPNDTNVHVVSLGTDWADRVCTDLAAGGLESRVLDVVPTALARATKLEVAYDPQAVVAVVDWGYTRVTFGVVVDGQPLFVRVFSGCGYGQVIAETCQALGLQQEEAQAVLRQREVASSKTEGDELSQILAECLAETLRVLVDELGRSLAYLQAYRPRLTPSTLVLFGGGATIKNSAELIAEQVGIPARVFQLAGQEATNEATSLPSELFGAAAALSQLAWEAAA